VRILFLPFSIASGLVAGAVARRVFDLMWGLVDDREPPEPEHREVSWGKLILALAIEGAVFRVVRGAIERGSRQSYMALTGSWPGEEHPDRT
jgi:uncharacterized protein DUF4235